MYTANHDKLEQMHRDLATNYALQRLIISLSQIAANAARLNTKERVATEIDLTGEEAAYALRAIQNLIKPLPPGTMTA
jgi:hypothetical protein